MMGRWELLLLTTREVSHFTKKKGNSQSLTVLGWIVLGTAHCELLQLSTAPPPPIHPEIRMIHGYQTVIIPCFWKRLAQIEELFLGQPIKDYQLLNILRLDPTGWAWVNSTWNSQKNSLFPKHIAYTFMEEYKLDLVIIRSGFLSHLGLTICP